MNWLSREAGQQRRQNLNNALAGAVQYYLGPTGIPQRLNALGILNPVNDMEQASQNALAMVAPGATGRERFNAGVGMVTDMATAVAPAYAASRVGSDGSAALVDGLTGVGAMQRQGLDDAGRRFIVDDYGGANVDYGIREKAERAARMIREKYGIEPQVTYHPTSWGKSAYLNARIPGPDGTYFDTGFRLSDHNVGEFRSRTDDVPTIIDGGDVSPESLFSSIEGAYTRALPQLNDIAARRMADASINKASFSAWKEADETLKASVSEAYKASPKGRAGKPWRNLTPQEKARIAYDLGLLRLP